MVGLVTGDVVRKVSDGQFYLVATDENSGFVLLQEFSDFDIDPPFKLYPAAALTLEIESPLRRYDLPDA